MNALVFKPWDSYRYAHHAFVADRERCITLLEAVGRARRNAEAAYASKVAEKAPDGWAPVPDEGYFLPVAPNPPRLTAFDLHAELGSLFAPVAEPHFRSLLARRLPIPDDERNAVRAGLANVGHAVELPPAIAEFVWRPLQNRLERLVRLRQLGAPEIIVTNEERLLETALGRVLENDERVARELTEHSLGEEGNLVVAALSWCTQTGEDVGLGPMHDHDFGAEGSIVPTEVGEAVVVVGEHLGGLAAFAADYPASIRFGLEQSALEAEEEARGWPGEDVMKSPEVAQAVEQRVQDLIRGTEARAAGLAEVASQAASAEAALIVVVQRFE
ncbi:MAG: hypothetical protein AAGE52_05320 [Myxococcota bacterium]